MVTGFRDRNTIGGGGSPVTRSLGCLLLLAYAGCSLLPNRERDGGDLDISRQYLQRGLSDLRNGRGSEAEQHFADAVQSCPHDAVARKLYAESLWKRGAEREAVEHMRASAQLAGPFDVSHVVRLGEMHLALGELALANQQAREAIRLATDDPSGWLLRGRVQRTQGHVEAALADFHRALAIDPDHLQVKLEIAELYNQIHRPQRSLAMLHAMTEQVPAEELSPRAAVLEGLALQQLNRHRDALVAFSRAMQGGEPVADLLLWSADSYLALGFPERAEWAVAQAEQVDADLDSLNRIRGRIAAARSPHAPVTR